MTIKKSYSSYVACSPRRSGTTAGVFDCGGSDAAFSFSSLPGLPSLTCRVDVSGEALAKTEVPFCGTKTGQGSPRSTWPVKLSQAESSRVKLSQGILKNYLSCRAEASAKADCGYSFRSPLAGRAMPHGLESIYPPIHQSICPFQNPAELYCNLQNPTERPPGVRGQAATQTNES
jgi:hypothetical protein